MKTMAFNVAKGHFVLKNALEGAFYTLYGAFFGSREIPAFVPEKSLLTNMR